MRRRNHHRRASIDRWSDRRARQRQPRRSPWAQAQARRSCACTGGVGADPRSVANAAANSLARHRCGHRHPHGAIEAMTDPQQAAVVGGAGASRFNATETAWAGAPDMGELPTAPVIVRHVGERSIVTIIDPARLCRN
jgi:hypothetical protein